MLLHLAGPRARPRLGLHSLVRLLDLMHRWMGGFIGLLLAVLGLTGALLVHKEAWLRWTLPHAADAQVQDGGALAAAATRLLSSSSDKPRSITFATDNFGLHRLSYGGNRGSYADQTGEIVTRWSSVWDRPELWLFDIHHYLLMGEAGGVIGGILGMIGLGFVFTGTILWWRTRRTFAFRLLPKRVSRPAILRHHRDLGIVVAPLLFLSMLTGSMITLRPVSDLLLSPLSSPAEMRAATAPPPVQDGPLRQIEWHRLISEVRTRYPEAEIRRISVPAQQEEPITIRARQPQEWLPNGRTLFWFNPADGRLLDYRDALALPTGVRLFNLLYPVHAAKVGGLPYRLVMTISGVALFLLGSLAVFSFWSRSRITVTGTRRQCTASSACSEGRRP